MITQIRNKVAQIKCRCGQGVIEYFVIMAVVLAVILASGLIGPDGGKLKNIFQGYFNRAVEEMR